MASGLLNGLGSLGRVAARVRATRSRGACSGVSLGVEVLVFLRPIAPEQYLMPYLGAV
jgi:hypothetical protein